mmetsp:Transcript_110490/g.321618  ORF Transcript_110490/g.321618 Transcript_110490/m.321618 type:complete len:271 (-) Transcript_110490:332-1144(-)
MRVAAVANCVPVGVAPQRAASHVRRLSAAHLGILLRHDLITFEELDRAFRQLVDVRAIVNCVQHRGVTPEVLVVVRLRHDRARGTRPVLRVVRGEDGATVIVHGAVTLGAHVAEGVHVACIPVGHSMVRLIKVNDRLVRVADLLAKVVRGLRWHRRGEFARADRAKVSNALPDARHVPAHGLGGVHDVSPSLGGVTLGQRLLYLVVERVVARALTIGPHRGRVRAETLAGVRVALDALADALRAGPIPSVVIGRQAREARPVGLNRIAAK